MKTQKAHKSSPSFANPEIQQIEQLLQFMTEHNLEEFEYSTAISDTSAQPSSGVVVSVPRMMARQRL